MLQKPRQITDITSKLAIHSPMTRTRLRIRLASTISAAVLGMLLLAPAGMAQDRSGNFLDNLFNRGDSPPADVGQPGSPPPSSPQMAQADPGDLSVRLDGIENVSPHLRNTFGAILFVAQPAVPPADCLAQKIGARLAWGGDAFRRVISAFN